jgi:hypothetical protein
LIEDVGNAVRAEAIRTLGSPLGRLVLLLPPAAAAARIFLGNAVSRVGRAQDVARAAALGGETIGVDLTENAYLPFAEGLAFGVGVAAVLLLVHGALSLAGEREAGTLRAALVTGASRASLVLGKALFGALLALAALPAVALTAFSAAAIPYEYGPVVEQGFPLVSVATIHVETLRGIAAAAIALLATHAFGLCISSLARAPGGAVAAALLAFLLFDAAEGLLRGTAEWVFATFVPSIHDGSYLGEVCGIAEGFSDAGFSDSTWWRNLLVPPAQALVFVAAAVAATRSRDA